MKPTLLFLTLLFLPSAQEDTYVKAFEAGYKAALVDVATELKVSRELGEDAVLTLRKLFYITLEQRKRDFIYEMQGYK